jgi:hypothetical protein
MFNNKYISNEPAQNVFYLMLISGPSPGYTSYKLTETTHPDTQAIFTIGSLVQCPDEI